MAKLEQSRTSGWDEIPLPFRERAIKLTTTEEEIVELAHQIQFGNTPSAFTYFEINPDSGIVKIEGAIIEKGSHSSQTFGFEHNGIMTPRRYGFDSDDLVRFDDRNPRDQDLSKATKTYVFADGNGQSFRWRIPTTETLSGSGNGVSTLPLLAEQRDLDRAIRVTGFIRGEIAIAIEKQKNAQRLQS